MSHHIQKTLLRECHSDSDSPFPAILSKCDCPQKSSHADTPPDSFNAILRQPRAKIIASRLHLLIFLVRLKTSDNISIEYWHQYQSQQRQPMQRHYTISNASDTGNASLVSMTQRTA